MSINWVMLAAANSDPPYTPLSNEQVLFKSPPRISLSVTTPAHYPGKQQQPFSLTSQSGVLYLTNRRVIYLPEKPTERFQSFAAPILNLHDSHVTAPFFGPNVVVALLQPVQGGGIPIPSSGAVELKLTFKDGGAFDFHTSFERLKERLHQAVETSRLSSNRSGNAQGGMTGLDVSNVNLEDLPAYQEASDGPLLSPVMGLAAQQNSLPTSPIQSGVRENGLPAPTHVDPPREPPPGYEEAQMQRLQEEAERRLNGGRM